MYEATSKVKNTKTGITIRNSDDVFNVLKKYITKKQEYFLALYLDGANKIVKKKVITKGILDKAIVHPREVFAYAVKKRCASIIIAHNHPSDEIKPSNEDKSITKRLEEAAKILGIDLLDHVIIGKSGFYSFNEDGLL